MAAQPPPSTVDFSEGTPPDALMPESRSAAFAAGAEGTPGDTATSQVLQFGGQQ